MTVIRLDVDRAADLVRHYEWQGELLRVDVTALAPLLDDAAAIGASLAPGTVAARLLALSEMILEDADDLSWRVAFVQAQGGDGVGLVMPERSPRLERVPIADLVALALEAETTAEMQPYLDELAVRAALQADDFAVSASVLGVAQVGQIQSRIAWLMTEEIEIGFAAEKTALRDDVYEALLAQVSPSQRLLDSFAVVLAGLSHTESGRAVLREAWGFDPDDPIRHDGALLGLIAGDWDGDFLREIATRAFSDIESQQALGTNLPGHWIPGFAESFPRLVDPQAVFLDALSRNPAAARAWLLEDDGFELVVSDDPLGWGWSREYNTQIRLSSERDRALADLVRSGFIESLPDPGRTGMFHQSVLEVSEQLVGSLMDNPDRLNPGIFASIAAHDVPGPETALAMADVITLTWPFLAPADPGDAVGLDNAGPAFAAVMSHDDARSQVTVGFGLYLESTFAVAFADGSERAIREAVEAGDHAFQLLDRGLDGLKLSDDDHALFRGVFGAVLGQGAKTGLTNLGVSGGWAGMALGYVSGTLIDEIGDRVFPEPHDDLPSSQYMLENLFIGGWSVPGGRERQPALVHVLMANAAFAADPDRVAALPTSRFLADGQIRVPADPLEREAFADWFHDTLYDDPELRAMVYETVDELATQASMVAPSAD